MVVSDNYVIAERFLKDQTTLIITRVYSVGQPFVDSAVERFNLLTRHPSDRPVYWLSLSFSAGDFDADQTLWLQPQQCDWEFIMEVSLSHYMTFLEKPRAVRSWARQIGQRGWLYIFLIFLFLWFELLPALLSGITHANSSHNEN